MVCGWASVCSPLFRLLVVGWLGMMGVVVYRSPVRAVNSRLGSMVAKFTGEYQISSVVASGARSKGVYDPKRRKKSIRQSYRVYVCSTPRIGLPGPSARPEAC